VRERTVLLASSLKLGGRASAPALNDDAEERMTLRYKEANSHFTILDYRKCLLFTLDI
jgi:hypothetical protein